MNELFKGERAPLLSSPDLLCIHCLVKAGQAVGGEIAVSMPLGTCLLFFVNVSLLAHPLGGECLSGEIDHQL